MRALIPACLVPARLVPACLIALFSCSVLAAEPIAAVTRAQGSGNLRNPDSSAARPLVVAAPVQFQDVITTAAESKAEIRFTDGAVLTLGAGSLLTIDAYVYDPGKARGGAVSLRQGVFRMITAAGPGPANLTVNTPLASIGIRGTDFWGEQSGERLRLLLLSGGPIELTTAAGTQILRDPGTLVEVSKDTLVPSAPVKQSPEFIAQAAKTVTLD